MTLQIFSTLLKAESSGVLKLPAAILERIPQHLADCRTRPLNYPITVGLFEVPFRNLRGETVKRPLRPIRMLWYPWAMECAAHWLQRCERRHASHDEVVRTRRILGHLLLTLGEPAVAEITNGFTYVASETVIGLTALDSR